ncbi:amidase [Acuticoccus sp. M5D2P5]|uniref:amidase n=1 Tax=Acuticoccus kalidii TaxID=2910977 RepID=UPI001F3C5D27|nr:amidase [Acuticoccus kalidii]MCF3936148.1 amidase [Acuticoccus kalidii]
MTTTMTAPAEARDLSASEAARAISTGHLTAEALARSCLDRVASRDRHVEAWAHIDPDQVIADARAADRAGPKGPLYGVPVAFKDIIDARGAPTGFNSPIYPDYHPRSDSAVSALVRLGGGIVMGKVATTEFANMHPGPCRNPLDLERTPGGSSSGSAAAVADRQVPLALGTQTSGSMLRPAAYCGIVGYKPSFGEISRVGVKQQSGSFDTLGLCARTLPDIALLRAVLTRTPHAPLQPADHPPRVRLCRIPEWMDAEEQGRVRVERAANVLADAGCDVDELALPADLFAEWFDVHRRIANFESARNFAFETDQHRDKLSATIYEGRILDGQRTTLDAYVAACRQAEAMRIWLEGAMAEVDCLLTLAAPGEAPLGMATGRPTFNSLWTLLYVPCLSLPYGKGAAGMPLSVQLVGHRFADEALLSAAATVQWILDTEDPS